MATALRARAELSEAEREELAALGCAVYPPEVLAAWPGRTREWAKVETSLLLRGPEGRLACHVGLVLREARLDGKPVTIGGIGAVMTHPEARRRGFAAQALSEARTFFAARGDVAFSLLCCDPGMLPYYGRQGWRSFGGTLRVTQHGAAEDFTFCSFMLQGIAAEAPAAGVIDLCGPPW